jgi:hypothetical protein
MNRIFRKLKKKKVRFKRDLVKKLKFVSKLNITKIIIRISLN